MTRIGMRRMFSRFSTSSLTELHVSSSTFLQIFENNIWRSQPMSIPYVNTADMPVSYYTTPSRYKSLPDFMAVKTGRYVNNLTNKTISRLEHFKTTKIVPLPTTSPDEECCICLELYDSSHKAVTVLVKDCYHRFGQECLERYLNSKSCQSNTCPQCRRVWYPRQSAMTDLENTTSIDSLLAENLSPVQAPSEPQRTTQETQRTSRQEEAVQHRIVLNHLDKVFQFLERIRDIINDGSTAAVEIGLALQTLGRHIRQIYQELQPQQTALRTNLVHLFGNLVHGEV